MLIRSQFNSWSYEQRLTHGRRSSGRTKAPVAVNPQGSNGPAPNLTYLRSSPSESSQAQSLTPSLLRYLCSSQENAPQLQECSQLHLSASSLATSSVSLKYCRYHFLGNRWDKKRKILTSKMLQWQKTIWPLLHTHVYIICMMWKLVT